MKMLDFHKMASIYLILLLCLISRSTQSVVERSEDEVAEYSNTCDGELGCQKNNTESDFLLLPNVWSFNLYTRKNPKKYEQLNSKESIKNSKYFDPKKPTKFIIHGYLASGPVGSWPGWMESMKNELLKNSDWNVIIVSWRCRPSYIQAARRTKMVGRDIAEFIGILEDVGQNPKDVHLLGHSLGAHVAGFAGKHVKSLGRITGLDPARPGFDSGDSSRRLHYTDAQFVDIIHTNNLQHLGGGYGLAEAIGNIDFYPNGGFHQPGCKSIHYMDLGHEMEQIMACNHHRAIYYFIESINSNCPFLAHQCDSYDHYKQGKCFSEDPTKISTMGLNTPKPSQSPGTKYFLDTGSSEPFCRPQLKVTLESVYQLENKSNNVDLISSSNLLLNDNETVGGKIRTTFVIAESIDSKSAIEDNEQNIADNMSYR